MKRPLMLELHPEILKKDGEPQFAVLPWHEFVRVQELLEDAQDLLDLRAAKSADDPTAPGLSLEQMSQRLKT